MALFAKDLAADGSLTTGQALSLAKRDYATTTQVWSPYDEKALQEVVHYGLPMYRIAATDTGRRRSRRRRRTAPRRARRCRAHHDARPDHVGAVGRGELEPDRCRAQRPRGTPDRSTHSTATRCRSRIGRSSRCRSPTCAIAPTDPAAGRSTARRAHHRAHLARGAELARCHRGRSSRTSPIRSSTALATRCWLDTTGDAIFPATLARVTRSTDGNGDPVGTAAVLGRPVPADWAGRRRATAVRQRNGASAVRHAATTSCLRRSTTTRGALVLAGRRRPPGFDVDTDATARRVVVAVQGSRRPPVAQRRPRRHRPASRRRPLDRWCCRAGRVWPRSSSSRRSCDDNGNCSTSNNKASNFVTVRRGDRRRPARQHGRYHVNGWFVSPPVPATIIGADPTCAIEYNLDGGGWVDYAPAPSISITGEGIHLLEARDDCGNNSLAVIPIDTKAPIVTAVTPTRIDAGWRRRRP